MKCQICKEKDKQIEFLKKIVDDLMSQYRYNAETFNPKYINEFGNVEELKETVDKDNIEVENSQIEDENE
jgi:ABC-type uncharacterized transport system substrate-binding protein